MKQVKIDGVWQTPREPIREWLGEIVGVTIDENLNLTGYVFRWQKITAVRKSPRHKPEIILTHFYGK